MIYLICGTQQDLLISKEIKRILRENNTSNSEYSSFTYSLLETSLDDIVNDCLTPSLFEDKKTIFVKDAFIFQNAQSRPKTKIEHNINNLDEYFANPSSFVDLIFIVKGNCDEKLSIYKKLKDIGRVSTIVDVEKEEWNGVIGQLIDQYQIKMDDDAKREFVNRTEGDLTIVASELKKLKMFGEHITKDIVLDLVARPLEDNMLGLMDAILLKDYKEAFNIFYDLKKKQEEPIRMISALATQLKFVYQVAILYYEGYSNNEIASKFQANIKPGRIYYTIKKINDNTAEEILEILDKLSKLDNDIKTGKIDRYEGFELFLSSLREA